MYSNDSAVLGTSTVAVPTVAAIALWPHLMLYILSAAIIVLAGLFMFFKLRNRNVAAKKK